MLGRTSYDFGVIPAGVGFTQAANIGVINTGTTSLTTSASVTPGFTLVGTPGTVPPGHELYARVLPDASNTPTPPGPLSGTLTLTVDGVPTGIPLTGDIEGAFAESLFVQSSAFTITGLAHCGGATTAMWCAPAGTDVAVTLGGYGPTYHATWSNPAPAYKITGINEQLIGMWVRDLAIAPDHHIAVGGRFTQSMRFPVIVYP